MMTYFGEVMIEPSHKSHNASDKYPTMHPFVTEMCTSVHISVKKWCFVGYGTGALWDLCNWSIVQSVHKYETEPKIEYMYWQYEML